MAFDTFVASLHGATDSTGSNQLSIKRYFKCDDTNATLVDSSPNPVNGTLVGTPTASVQGYVYGESNGGNALTFNGTSQYANLGAVPGFLSAAYSKGIFLSMLFKADNEGASSFQPKAFVVGLENGAPNRGIRIYNWNDHTFKVELFDDAGIKARWDFNRGGAHYWDDTFWHQLTIVITPTQGVASTASQCQLWIDAVRNKCTAHTPVTLGTLSDWNVGRLAIAANSEAGGFGWWTSMGPLSVQRFILGTGSPTERQIVDLYRECSKTIMGIANPAVFCYLDNAADVGATGDGDKVAAVTNYGDSAFTVTQGTAANRPQWTTRYGGCVDIGSGLQSAVQADAYYLNIDRSSINRRLLKGDNTSMIVHGLVTATYLFQTATWFTLFGTAGTPPTTPKQSHMFSANWITGTSEAAQIGIYREGGTTYSAWSDGRTTDKPPTSLPSFSVLGGLSGLYPNGSVYEGSYAQGCVYVDGEIQRTNLDNGNGSPSTPVAGTGTIATALAGAGTSSRCGGLYKLFVWTNRPLHPVELADFYAACKARYPNYIADLQGSSKAYLFVGDSHTSGNQGTIGKTDGWHTLLPISSKIPCYNASIGGYFCSETAGARDMDTRINNRMWFNHLAGKDLIVYLYLGNNDFSTEGETGSTLALQWSTVRNNIIANAAAAGVRSVRFVGIRLRPDRAPAFNALIGTTEAPADWVVTPPSWAFGADGLHPNGQAMIDIANAVQRDARGSLGGLGSSKLGRVLALGSSAVWPGG